MLSGLIVFRTNAGEKQGLGHLTRCTHVARELIKYGAQCLIILDYVEDAVLPFLDGLSFKHLYPRPQSEIDALTDAALFLDLIMDRKVNWVVVDDYRLGIEWETTIKAWGKTSSKASGPAICSFDDIQRCHQCDLLVDTRWRGSDTAGTYDTLIPVGATRLLGPAYVPLSRDFQSTPVPKDRSDQAFSILIGLGGGGNLDVCTDIVNCLLEHKDEFSRSLRLKPIVGPLSTNAERLIKCFDGVDEVEPIVGEISLYSSLCQTDFFIGAAGGTLHQLLALRVPALTFAVANNQKSDVRHLEDIGHYFHINTWSSTDLVRLPQFIKIVIENIDRVRRLGQNPRIPIDGYGAQRIAQAMLNTGNDECLSTASSSNDPSDSGSKLSAAHYLRPVTDGDINHYRKCRNLQAKRLNIIGTDEISSLLDYAWWFGTNRESWLLSKQGSRCLYIWHELKSIDCCKFLICGWFACDARTEYQDAVIALDWQLKYCGDRFPGVPWIAAIHRQNKHAKRMKDHFGFQEVDRDAPDVQAIAACFEDSTFEDFYFVTKPSRQSVK